LRIGVENLGFEAFHRLLDAQFPLEDLAGGARR
jgi:hypothetical protein